MTTWIIHEIVSGLEKNSGIWKDGCLVEVFQQKKDLGKEKSSTCVSATNLHLYFTLPKWNYFAQIKWSPLIPWEQRMAKLERIQRIPCVMFREHT